MSTIAIPVRKNVLADIIARTWAADAALVIGSAALVGLLAQISIHLGFTPVPVTGQTLGVMLVGSALGWRRAGLALSLYVVAGSLGVPWFANHASGHPMANFGYLVGFVIAAPLLGWLAARGNDRTVTRALVSMAVGDLIIFAVGVPWLASSIHVSLATAIALGLTPFIPGELLKATVAGLALPASWRLVDRAARQN